jgi:acetyltransferase
VWSRFAELYPLVVERLARSGEVDAVVAVLLQRAASAPVAAGLAEAVARLRAEGVRVPVYVCWVAPHGSRPAAEPLHAAGVPCFHWPERTARAVGHAARYAAARDGVRPLDPLPPGEPSGLPDGWLDLDDGARLLGRYGIATAPSRTCSTETEAAHAAAELGYPAVVKLVHPGLLHKAAAGGVRVGLPVPTAVRAAATELLALVPGARLLVQRQVAGTEVVVGGVRDPQFGPAVLAGLGGVLVEALDDVALRLPPLRRSDALDLFASLRGRPLLDGVDTDALADTVVAVAGLLVAEPDITELDLNPVLATATGCVAVDWRIRVGNPPAQDEDGGGDLPHHVGEMAR